MKTPEEIKKAHRCCFDMICLEGECAYEDERINWLKGGCFAERGRDALGYIQQLENQIGELTEKVSQLEAAQSAAETFRRERDALLADLKEAAKMDCSTCKYYAPDDGRCENADFVCRDCSLGLKDCPCHTCEGASNWNWRGVVKTDDEAGD